MTPEAETTGTAATLAPAHAFEVGSQGGRPESRADARAAVTVVIPAYNEERGVAEVVRHVGEVLSGAGIEHEIGRASCRERV